MYSTSQKANVEYLTVKDGLPQNTVQSIVKDKHGFMWFGTWNGLCRYDGYKFKTYYSIPGDTTSIANSRIHYIYKDVQGTLWVATFNSFICRYNYLTDNFTRFKPEQLPQSIRDSTNRLRNLIAFNTYAEDLKSQLGKFELSQTKEHIVFQTTPINSNGLNDNNVYCAYKDNRGILWLGTSSGGVNKINLNAKPFHHVSVVSETNNTISVPIRAIYADSKDLWLGTNSSGIIHIDQTTKVQKHLVQGPVGKSVRSIFKDTYGDIWIGYRTGLDKYEFQNKRFVNYFNENTNREKNSYRFLSIAEDPIEGDVWFGTFNNVFKYDRRTNTFKQQHLGNYFNNSSAVCLFFDSKSNLWIGTEYSGIIQTKRDPITRAWVDTITYNAHGVNPKLPDERVYSITEDEQGNIWAGTSNGLCRLDPSSGKIKLYTRRDGLSDHYITKLLSDGKGNIWISHKKGLSKLTTSTGIIRNYTVDDKAQGYEFMDGSGYADRQTGEMYFGGINGLVTFRPWEIVDDPSLPTVALTELQVLNKPIGVGDTVNGQAILSAPLYLTKSITLTHLDRSFSIEFAALSYANPEKNQYAYMLEGQDKEWIHSDASRRVASYSNLPAGKYIFRVKASNSDGVWNPTSTSIKIIVLPPWWKTGWAYFFYLLLFLLIIYGTYRLVRARQEYNRQLLTERLKAEKAQEIEELKSRFFTNVSHEFRTPLTLIIDPLESLLAGKLSGEKARDYYSIMYRNARRLLGLINQFLDFRKLESGNIRLRVTTQNIVSFVRNTVGAFEFQAQQQNIHLEFQTEVEELKFGFDADVVDKILYNLLSNAFKFTGEGGNISVSLTVGSGDPSQIVLSVTDDGIGIPSELLDKIFEPFYQVERKKHSNRGGTGVGLSLTMELATLHKGSITVSSKPHIATKFAVMLSDLGPETSELTTKVGQPFFQVAEDLDVFTSFGHEQVLDTELPLVLVVEDNADVRGYLKMNLSAHYKVIDAADGNEGLEKALGTIPDLIISDIMMPGMNGLDLCQKLKSDEKTSHIPVVLLTARQSDQYQIEGYETGADAYIGKPFSTAVLLARVKNLMDSRKKLRELFSKSAAGFDTQLLATNAVDKAFLGKVTKLVEENMSNEDFSVEWLATRLFLSRIQLYRKIKAVTNLTVHEFVTSIRLNKAAELLQEGQLSVTEIAFAVGYSDSTSFSRVFQKQYGQTPKKFSQGKNIDLS